MIDRDDLVFATVAQLAGLIKSDWEEEVPEEIQMALRMLATVDEPESPIVMLGVKTAFTAILGAGRRWNSEDSIPVKKELSSRIRQYDLKLQEAKEQYQKSQGNISILS